MTTFAVLALCAVIYPVFLAMALWGVLPYLTAVETQVHREADQVRGRNHSDRVSMHATALR